MMAVDHCAAGVMAFNAGDYDTAVQELEFASVTDPGDFRAFTFLGATYAQQRRYNAAIGAFKRASTLKPGVAKVHYNLAQAYEAAGVPTEAWFEYKKALEIDPLYQLAKMAFVELSARMKTAREQRLELVA